MPPISTMVVKRGEEWEEEGIRRFDLLVLFGQWDVLFLVLEEVLVE